MLDVTGGGQEEQTHIQGAVAAQAKEGRDGVLQISAATIFPFRFYLLNSSLFLFSLSPFIPSLPSFLS